MRISYEIIGQKPVSSDVGIRHVPPVLKERLPSRQSAKEEPKEEAKAKEPWKRGGKK